MLNFLICNVNVQKKKKRKKEKKRKNIVKEMCVLVFFLCMLLKSKEKNEFSILIYMLKYLKDR